MSLYAHEPYLGGVDLEDIKISFTDGLTFNVEPNDDGDIRLFRSRKYKHEPFRSQNHERAAQISFERVFGRGA